ncbi:Ger(x)C family spore germination protein [Virgibacillus ndiopensis]|uniref:Ger(x)C family spore germination protein n=1 Tax=Virgibacillus ndiopensis TaxID=2004408 RepID=UPI000C06BDF1|nr:Ger(x)C family spore germination protein [Virgibacillus ndiopensis]
MPRRYIIFFILIFVSVTVNFTMPKRVIDKIQMVTVVGYDYVDDNTINGTVITPTFLQKGQIMDLVYTGNASMVYDLGTKLNTVASENLENGKLEVVVFNKELAEHGIKNYIDFLLREPSIGSGLYLAVSEGSTNELLNSVKSHKGAGVYLSDLIEHNIQRQKHPETNLKTFSYSIECETCDPFLPYFKIVDGKPKIDAIALFKKDKYLDKIPIDEAFVFNILLGDMDNGDFILEKKGYKAAIQNIDSERKIIVNQHNENMSLQVNIDVKGVIREYTGKRVLHDKEKIEKDLERELNKKAKEMIKNFQEKNIDPLGIKEIIRSKVRDLSVKQINDTYPSISISTDITYTNMESGTRR